MSKHSFTWLERVLALVLVCVMVLGMVPGAVFAAEADEGITPPSETTLPTEETGPNESIPSETEVTDPTVTTVPSEPEETDPSEPEETDPSEPEETEPAQNSNVELTVKNMAGEAMANVPVTFEVRNGGASVVTIPVLTDSNGVTGVSMAGFENNPNVTVAYTIKVDGYVTVSGVLDINNRTAEVKMAKLLTMKVEQDGEGSVKLTSTDTITHNQDGTYTVVEGSTVTVEANAAEGYQFGSIAVDGTVLQNTSFTASADSTIRVVFVQIYTVTITCTGDGTIKVEDHTEAKEGAINVEQTEDGKISITVNANAENKYCIGSVQIIDAKSEDVVNKSYETVVTTETFEVDWNQNYQVKAVFVPDSYTVTTEVTAETKEGLENTNAVKILHATEEQEVTDVAYMGSYRIQVVPAEAYVLNTLTVGDKVYTAADLTDNMITVTGVTADQVIKADFVIKRFKITLPESITGGDAWIGEKSVAETDKLAELTVAYGEDVTIQIIADANYEFKAESLMINGQAYNGASDGWTACALSTDESDIHTLVISGVKKDLNVSFAFAATNASKENVTISSVGGSLVSDKFQHGVEVFIFSKDTEYVKITAKDTTRKIDGQRKGTPIGGYTPYNTVYDALGTSGAYYLMLDNKNSSVDYLDRVRIKNPGMGWSTIWGQTAYFVIDKKVPVIGDLKFNGESLKAYYNQDVVLTFTAEDPNTYDHQSLDFASGVDSVEYLIYTGEMPADAFWSMPHMEEDGSYSITVDAETYTAEAVKVAIRITDNAGNSCQETYTFGINPVKPVVTVNVTDEVPTDLRDPGDYYYNCNRIVTITVIDKAYTLDIDDLEFKDDTGVKFLIVDGQGKNNSWPWSLNRRVTELEDGFVQAEIEFKLYGPGEANITYGYTNKAGSVVEDADIEYTGENHHKFIIDTTAPEGKIKVDGSIWEGLMQALSFGAYAKSVTVSSEWSDVAYENYTNGSNGVTQIEEVAGEVYGDVLYYYGDLSMLLEETTDESTGETVTNKLSEDALLKKLDELYDAGEFKTDLGTISDDGNYVFFARAVDQAGNVAYIASNGVVVDNVKSLVDVSVHEDSKLSDGKNAHKDDIKMQVTVNDMVDENGYFSGIQKVVYEIRNSDGSKKDTGVLLELTNKPEPTMTAEELEEASSFEGTFKVYVEKGNKGPGGKDDDKVRFNEKDIVVTVTATDFAGNEKTDIYTLNVNTVKPVIEITPVEWVENDAKPGAVEGYYNPKRELTITITDREDTFAAENVIFNLTRNGTKVEAPVLGDWTHSEDGNKHYVTLTVAEDGVYDLTVDYTNTADMAADQATVDTFTVDQTNPTAVITIGENEWKEFLETITFGLYTNDTFVATVTAMDDTSPVSVAWYMTDSADEANEINENNVADLNWTELGGGKKEETYSGEFSDEQRYTFYIRVIDYAGNVIYLNSDGVILDRKAAVITLTPEEIVSEVGKANGVYGLDNGEINVGVEVSEIPDVVEGSENTETQYAGISTIEYWVYSNVDRAAVEALGDSYGAAEVANVLSGEPTAYAELFNFKKDLGFEEKNPVYSELTKEWAGTITVDPAANNSCDVAVLVKVVDNAGNDSYKIQLLDIDVATPTIDVTYDSEDTEVSNGKYYQAARTATVKITERTHHFNPEKVVVTITAKDVNGNDIMSAADATVKLADTMMLSDFQTEEGATPDEAVHTATIVFEEDANYTFAVDYIDNAGNAADQYVAEDFVVDESRPAGSITASTPVYDEYDADQDGDTEELVRYDEATWEALVEQITFQYWTKNEISIGATSADVTSPIQSVEYFVHRHETAEGVTAEATILTWEELDKVTWTDLNNPDEKLPLKPNGQYVVYLKITDFAGNYEYISTDCLIADSDAPDKDVLAPNIDSSIEDGKLYNQDVPVDIKVSEQIFGNTFSGLKTVSYKVFNLGQETKSEVLYAYDSKNETSLRRIFEQQITVLAADNNSNDVKVVIYAEDNAGNHAEYEISFMIDITAPVITVDYDNNSGSGVYYKDNRTATIRITERNFKVEDVLFTIGVSADGKAPEMSAWRTVPGKLANGDDTVQEIDLVYNTDGDYTFDIAYTDLAKNPAAGWSNYREAVTNPASFTIDKTLPVISVKYNNNAALNGKYFAATRTATITITEHNFNPSAEYVKVNMTAARGGVVPSYRWTSDSTGNVHTAVLEFKNDGDYTFQISMTDLAGNANSGVNYNGAVAPNDFVVDTDADMITVASVENGEAYGYGETLIPDVTISDINLDSYNVTLTGIQKDKTIDLSDKANALLHRNGGDVHGLLDLFTNDQNLDGIYTLKITSLDEAGNTDEETIVFTVNRYGSVYVYGEYLTQVITDRYNQAIVEDLIIHEYNADKLIAGSLNIEITLDGRPLENVIYTVNPSDMNPRTTGDSGWYEYTYVISKDNFQADGVYVISVSSADATGNTPENSNYEDMGIQFMVDNTIPEISIITGLEEISVFDSEQRVDFTVFDAIGLESVVIYIDGEVYETFTDFGGDINNYSGFFTIYEKDEAQTVRVVVTDLAGKIIDTDLYGVANEEGVVEIAEPAFEFNKTVTVSTNRLALWFNNKPLFWGTIAGVAGLGLIFFLIILFKRKKNEDEEEAQAAAK